ncbi:hypothetical protein KFZ56_04880 [Virgibacillus sp. NKC19-3]|uniref:hypothetical protein n=1 Tax=Virgibacillus saliphilus TaxID=2831674 RepID=UPI001C9A4A51|nr:hypothetical protein [Virgibacillus sp. NKC19-3]MBY7142424.1 hypothetical protein [Virgibacillus sp. NKC19-3]
MRNIILVTGMIFLLCLLTACGDDGAASNDDSNSNQQEENQSQETSNQSVPDDIFYEAGHVDGIVRDTGRYIVEEFGYRSNISADIEDGQHTVGLEETDGNLTRFYNTTNAIRYEDDATGRSVKLSLIGELGEDYDDTYVSAMKRTKKILDFLFTYDTVDVDQINLSWYYPYKSAAGEEDYTLFPVYELTLDRDEYGENWENLDESQMDLDTIAHDEHMIIPKGAYLMPFVDNRERHAQVGKEYDMRGLKVTLLGAEDVSSINGESAEDYCGENRDCSTFMQVEMQVKNDREYPMIMDAKSYIDLLYKKPEEGDDVQSTTAYAREAEGAVTYQELQPGEEVVLSPYIPLEDDVEYIGLRFTTEYADYTQGFDQESLATVDESYVYSWLMEDVRDGE